MLVNTLINWLLSFTSSESTFCGAYSLMIELTVCASVTAVFIILFKLIFRNRLRAKWHFLVWLILIVRIFAYYLPESPVSVFNVIRIDSPPAAVQTYEAAPKDTSEIPGNTSNNTAADKGAKRPERTTVRQTENAVTESTQAEPTVSLESSVPVDGIVVFVWVGGAALLFIYFIAVMMAFMFRQKCRDASEEENAVLVECKKLLKIKRKVNLYHCDTTPFLFSSSIHIPEGLSEPELRATLIHELCHLKHHDVLWSSAAISLLCLNWFNPIMWVCFFLFKRDVELYCDERTLKYTGDKKSYAMLLLNTATRRNRYVFGTTSLNSGKSDVKRRIRFLAKFKKPKFFIAALAVLTVVVIGVLCLTNAAKPAADSSAVSVIISDSWFNDFSVKDDKVYIDCDISLRNNTDSQQRVKLAALCPDDVSGGLLKNEKIYAVDNSENDRIFIINANSEKHFENVVFLGDYGGTKIKRDRLLPEIIVETLNDDTASLYADYCAEKAAEYGLNLESHSDDDDEFGHDRWMGELTVEELDEFAKQMKNEMYRVKKDKVSETITDYYIYSDDEFIFINNYCEPIYNSMLWYGSSSAYKLYEPDTKTSLGLIKKAGGDTSFGCAVDASSDALYELTGAKLIYVPEYHEDEWIEMKMYLVNSDGAVEIKEPYFSPYVCDIDSDGDYEVVTLTDDNNKDCLTAYGFDKGAPYIKYRKSYKDTDSESYLFTADEIGCNGSEILLTDELTTPRTSYSLRVENGEFVYSETRQDRSLSEVEQKAFALDLSVKEYQKLVETLPTMNKSKFGIINKNSAILDINGDGVAEFVRWEDSGSGIAIRSFEAYQSSDGELKQIGFGGVSTNGQADECTVILNGKAEVAKDGKSLIFTYKKQSVRVAMDGDYISASFKDKYGLTRENFISQMYNDEDFEKAVQAVKDKFAKLKKDTNSTGEVGKLYKLNYLGDDYSKKELDYCNKLREDGEPEYTECLVFVSLFHTNPDVGAAWNPDDDYTWTWHLARRGKGDWTVVTAGY